MSFPPRWLFRYRFELFCLTPLVVYLAVFTLGPVIRVVQISFTDSLAGGWTLSHYQDLLSNEEFRGAFRNTLVVALGSLTLEITAGLILAMILSARPAGMGLLRSLFMLPLAIPTVVAAVMMSYMFSTSGWVNRILTDTGLISSSVNWMEGGGKSLFTVIVADSWKVTPLVMLILLAGLQSINRELYRAARIDGAGPLTVFRKVTLPLLMPSLSAAMIVRGIDAFRIFSLALVLMGENLKVIGTYAYLEYAEYDNTHLSAASSVILFVIIFAAVMLYIRIVGKRGVQAT